MSSDDPLTLVLAAHLSSNDRLSKVSQTGFLAQSSLSTKSVKLSTPAPSQPLWLFHSSLSLLLPWEPFLQSSVTVLKSLLLYTSLIPKCILNRAQLLTGTQ